MREENLLRLDEVRDLAFLVGPAHAEAHALPTHSPPGNQGEVDAAAAIKTSLPEPGGSLVLRLDALFGSRAVNEAAKAEACLLLASPPLVFRLNAPALCHANVGVHDWNCIPGSNAMLLFHFGLLPTLRSGGRHSSSAPDPPLLRPPRPRHSASRRSEGDAGFPGGRSCAWRIPSGSDLPGPFAFASCA
eukprot:scaffold7373_cov232-Pinguiococcus_pyrenoidosus.AAC.5